MPRNKKQAKPKVGAETIQHYGARAIRKRKSIETEVDNGLKRQKTSYIVIPFRDDGKGKGAYYDHHTTQMLTGAPTCIAAVDPGADIQLFNNQSYYAGFELSYGNNNEHGKKTPALSSEIAEHHGLLFIPGTTRENKEKQPENFMERVKTENKLLKSALLKGQPILAVCGGAWTVWAHSGGKMRKVKDHAYSRMLSIKSSTGKVGYNVQMHRIAYTNESLLLKASMDVRSNKNKNHTATIVEQPTVNSVHWLAVDETTAPSRYIVSAYSVAAPEIKYKNRNGSLMQPEENCAEAFESKNGAPILGVQWHPEAYTNNTDKKYTPEKHQNILRYMQKSGTAYLSKRRMLAEFSTLTSTNQSFAKWQAEKLTKVPENLLSHWDLPTSWNDENKFQKSVRQSQAQEKHKNKKDQLKNRDTFSQHNPDVFNSFFNNSNTTMHPPATLTEAEKKQDKMRKEKNLQRQQQREAIRKASSIQKVQDSHETAKFASYFSI